MAPTAPILPPTLKHARVAFTGRLASMRRAEAHGVVREAGGVPVTTVSRRTSMLIVGMEGWPLLSDGNVSRKLRRAEALRRSGTPIRVVCEAEFLEFAGLEKCRPSLRKSYPQRQVCDLVGIEPALLRRWEALGLVRSHEGLYDFQDLVSLQTISALVGAGVSAQTIGRSIRKLASVLPGTERPLAQLTIVAEGPRALLAELEDLRMAPDGQLILDFEASGRGEEMPAGPVPFHAPNEPLGAEEWFERALAFEIDERLPEAERAYRAALAARPHFAEAQFNLANVLRAQERPDAAEERYRIALEHAPDLAEGWYNLADLLEEAARPVEAIECLRRALEARPDYADAHFNLAYCCEQAGRSCEAATHWQAYLTLDPESEWADLARVHLGAG